MAQNSIPLFNVTLRNHPVLEIGPGISIRMMRQQELDIFRNDPGLYKSYSTSIDKLTVCLTVESSAHVSEDLLLEGDHISVFVGVVLRLVTEIPVAFPFWFSDNAPDSNTGFGTTNVQVYGRKGYTYVIDDSELSDKIEVFKSSIGHLLDIFLDEKKRKESIIFHALDFMAICYQTKHVPPRIVSLITFQEILFLSRGDTSESTHKLSERVSWYLENSSDIERYELFKRLKALYSDRSRIVHGGGTKKGDIETMNEIEAINTRLIIKILRNQDYDFFDTEGRTDRVLKLGLGIFEEVE